MTKILTLVLKLISWKKIHAFAMLILPLFNSGEISSNLCNYLNQNQKECVFNLAAYRFKIPPEILKSFYHVETTQGSDLGKYQVYKRLKDFENIKALRKICRNTGQNFYKVTGSAGGAVGETQFMPATWIIYGIDANQDKVKNPWDFEDAVFTTANFLAKKGWHKKPLKAIQSYCPKSKAYPKKILKTAEKLFAWNGKF